MAEPVIRRVRDDELGDVLELWRLAGVTPPSVSDSIEGLTRLVREPAALLLVATINDQIVGSVIGGWDGWRGNIYRLAVTPELRRHGIARRLVREISRELFGKGVTRLSALVEHEHQWAIDFWDSVSHLGFLELGGARPSAYMVQRLSLSRWSYLSATRMFFSLRQVTRRVTARPVSRRPVWRRRAGRSSSCSVNKSPILRLYWTDIGTS